MSLKEVCFKYLLIHEEVLKERLSSVSGIVQIQSIFNGVKWKGYLLISHPTINGKLEIVVMI